MQTLMHGRSLLWCDIHTVCLYSVIVSCTSMGSLYDGLTMPHSVCRRQALYTHELPVRSIFMFVLGHSPSSGRSLLQALRRLWRSTLPRRGPSPATAAHCRSSCPATAPCARINYSRSPAWAVRMSHPCNTCGSWRQALYTHELPVRWTPYA